MTFLSQSGLTAIDEDKIQFFAIDPQADGGGTFKLLTKTPVVQNNFYEYLILFEHEDIEVVKHVMRFLANRQFTPRNVLREHKNILVVDLPDLYDYGMKKITPDLLNKTGV